MPETAKELGYAQVYDLFYRDAQKKDTGVIARTWAGKAWDWKGATSTAKSVVDLGCGPGYLARCVPPEMKLYGIDVSKLMLEEMPISEKKRYETLLHADMCSMPADWSPPWPPADILFCADVLEHIREADLESFWRAAKACVRPGAEAILAISLVVGKYSSAGWGSLHQTVWPSGWWLEWIKQRVEIHDVHEDAHKLSVYGLVKSDVPPEAKAKKLTYAELYDALYRDGYPDGPAQHVWRWRRLPAAVTSILDLGCGRGSLGLEVPNPISVYGIDVAEAAIKRMDQARKGSYERLAVCDLTKEIPRNWPYAAMLFCVDVLEHIEPEDLDAFWRNAIAILKRRAWVRLSIGIRESIYRHKEHGNLHRNLQGFHAWTSWLLQTVDLTACRGATIEVQKHAVFYQGRLLAPKKQWKESSVATQMKRLEAAPQEERPGPRPIHAEGTS